MTQFRVPAVNLPRLEADIADLNKRAKRLKVEPIAFAITGWDVVEGWSSKLEMKVERRYALVEIEGRAPKISGWSFAAKIEPTEAGNLVKALPGVESVPERFRSADMTCDHCKTGRWRKEVFVVSHEDGRWAQVGRNCLRDFLGHEDPEMLARIAEFEAAVGELASEAEADGWGCGGGRAELTEDLDTYVATVSAFIRQNGWVARSSFDGMPTADQAWRYLFPWSQGDKDWIRDLQRDGFAVTEADRDLARKALEWAREVEATNDYLHNLKTSATLSHVIPKTSGIIASVVRTYMREVEKREVEIRRKERVASQRYLGTVGQRETFADLTVANIHYFDSMFGTMEIIKLVDAEGNALVWKTGSSPDWAEQGETVSVKATVADHTTYRDEPQTELKRVTLVA